MYLKHTKLIQTGIILKIIFYQNTILQILICSPIIVELNKKIEISRKLVYVNIFLFGHSEHNVISLQSKVQKISFSGYFGNYWVFDVNIKSPLIMFDTFYYETLYQKM